MLSIPIKTLLATSLVLAWLSFFGLAQTPMQAPDRTANFGRSLELAGKSHESKPGPTAAPSPTDPDLIRVKTDLVVVDALVTDSKGNAIVGLGKQDFIVSENGVEKKVEHFAGSVAASIPRSIVLILDYSFSMKPFVRDSVAAAKVMVDKLGPLDRVAIVTDDIKLLTDFTSDKEKLKNALDDFTLIAARRTGLSLQFSSLAATLQELFDDEDLRPIVILQSDGDEYWSFSPSPGRKYTIPAKSQIREAGCNGLCQRVTFDDIHSLVARSRATLYSIVPGYKLLGVQPNQQTEIVRNKFFKRFPNWPKDPTVTVGYLHDPQNALQDLSSVSGGYLDFLEEPSDAEKVYSAVFQTMSKRYSVGYYPDTSGAGSGQWRNVMVTVRNHPEYRVTGRKRFFIKN